MSNFDSISVKSKIGVEFRRYALKRKDISSFTDFYKQIEKFHHLDSIPFVIFYLDSQDFLLPINNDDNLAKAIYSSKRITFYDPNHKHPSYGATTGNMYRIGTEQRYYKGIHQQHASPIIIQRPYLTLFIERRGEYLECYNKSLSGKYKKSQPFKGISRIMPSHDQNQQKLSIGMPEDFRQVSSIIDVDIVPQACRRVRIAKHSSDRKPLGFYIRDGTYRRLNSYGQLVLVKGIFISRLVSGGLAESTGLLGVNDEVLEVNGIQVTHGKTLEQVTDMMVANSSNLIITIRPGKMNDFPLH